MADLPLLFSPAMIEANLAGRKRKTRRVLRTQPDFDATGCTPANMGGARDLWWDYWKAGWAPVQRIRVPYCVGDRLWIRERVTRFDRGTCDQWIWYYAGRNDVASARACRPLVDAGEPYCSVDRNAAWPFPEGPGGGAPYSVPAIHMPRWASRLTAIVEKLRVERLQDISEEDAIAEGIEPIKGAGWRAYGPTPKPFSGAAPGVLSHGRGIATSDPRHSFATLWESVNGEGAWSRNPWILVVSYRLERLNVDDLGGAA